MPDRVGVRARAGLAPRQPRIHEAHDFFYYETFLAGVEPPAGRRPASLLSLGATSGCWSVKAGSPFLFANRKDQGLSAVPTAAGPGADGGREASSMPGLLP